MFNLKDMLTRTERWQHDYLFELGAKNWLLHGVLVVLIGIAIIANYPGEAWPYFWILTELLLSAAISLVCWQHINDPQRSDLEARNSERRYWLLTAIIALVWGLGALGVARGHQQLFLVFSIAMCGNGVSAIPIQNAVPRICLTTIWVGAPFLAIANFVREFSLTYTINAIIVVLLGVLLTIMCQRMFNFLKTSTALNTSLDSKVGELTRLTDELRRARCQADEANLSKSRFLAQASHDLRQPIHAIGLFTACLKDAELGQAERTMVDNIDRSLESATQLFSSLLDISRLDVGGITPSPVSLSLKDFMSNLSEQNAELAAASGCKVKLHIADVWVYTDPALLSTLVQNLISNAFKYASSRPILIGTRHFSDGTKGLLICDQGPGIHEDQLDAIFKEFYRIENDTSQRVEGLGLGLAIVQRIADILRLKVEIRSRPGHGTSVLIKGLQQVERHAPHPVQRMPHHSIDGMTITLIDNDIEILKATENLLTKWGCTVKSYARAPRSIAPCDVMVVDYDLGGSEDGVAVVKRLRRARPDMPAIIISGRSESTIMDEIRNTGMPLLAKPVRPAEFRAVLTHMRQRAQNNAETRHNVNA